MKLFYTPCFTQRQIFPDTPSGQYHHRQRKPCSFWQEWRWRPNHISL